MFYTIVFQICGNNIDSATRIISRAAALSGYFIQSYSGKNNSFIKIDKKPIVSKQAEVPDYVIIIDSNADIKALAANMKEKSNIIINSAEKVKNTWLQKKKIKAFSVDIETLMKIKSDRNAMSIIIAGAVAKVIAEISAKNMKLAMEAELPENKTAAAIFEEAYKCVK